MSTDCFGDDENNHSYCSTVTQVISENDEVRSEMRSRWSDLILDIEDISTEAKSYWNIYSDVCNQQTVQGESKYT